MIQRVTAETAPDRLWGGLPAQVPRAGAMDQAGVACCLRVLASGSIGGGFQHGRPSVRLGWRTRGALSASPRLSHKAEAGRGLNGGRGLSHVPAISEAGTRPKTSGGLFGLSAGALCKVARPGQSVAAEVRDVRAQMFSGGGQRGRMGHPCEGGGSEASPRLFTCCAPPGPQTAYADDRGGK